MRVGKARRLDRMEMEKESALHPFASIPHSLAAQPLHFLFPPSLIHWGTDSIGMTIGTNPRQNGGWYGTKLLAWPQWSDFRSWGFLAWAHVNVAASASGWLHAWNRRLHTLIIDPRIGCDCGRGRIGPQVLRNYQDWGFFVQFPPITSPWEIALLVVTRERRLLVVRQPGRNVSMRAFLKNGNFVL